MQLTGQQESLGPSIRMTAALVTHRSRIVIGFVAVLLFLCGWLWLADRFFDGPTTEFSVQHERGPLALVEQIGAALYTPAWFV